MKHLKDKDFEDSLWEQVKAKSRIAYQDKLNEQEAWKNKVKFAIEQSKANKGLDAK